MNEWELLFTERLAPIAPQSFQLMDESGQHIGHAGNTGGGHFQLTVVSDRFAGKNRLERHRLVYACFAYLIPHRIHALIIAAYTPDEL